MVSVPLCISLSTSRSLSLSLLLCRHNTIRTEHSDREQTLARKQLTATVKFVGGFGRLKSLSSVSGEIACEPASDEYKEDILRTSSSTTLPDFLRFIDFCFLSCKASLSIPRSAKKLFNPSCSCSELYSISVNTCQQHFRLSSSSACFRRYHLC